ncbi:atos homolog protein B [Denticeps clupeoides]|uniref:Atos homolog protein B n=1 Tax=Denticeps clupeoides TaxID=299321 RepID=A0AAY4ATH9_9TELE|nr:protein FAM214B [Denticeps clupeoides]XP_028853121.1 protein FAM214B [Denticeps clupeoides]
MRHIHVELARKEPSVQLPAQEGDLPPTSTPSDVPESGVHRGVPRPFGEEEIRLQKVYQLSIFSQRGGFSEPSECQRLAKVAMKRSLDDPLSPVAQKRLHESEEEKDEELEGELLCIPGSEPLYSVLNLKDPENSAAKTPPQPPLSPTHSPVPARRPAQHNHDRPVPDAWAPLSPKSPPMVDLQLLHPHRACDAGPLLTMPSVEPPPAGDVPVCSVQELHSEGFSNGMAVGHGTSWTTGSPSLYYLSDPKDPVAAMEWVTNLESSPPERKSPHPPPNYGIPSSEKSPVDPHVPVLGSASGHCPTKKRLLSSSDTGDSCSEDEGPSTSKKSRLALLAPGLGLASCRSTDAKAAPFWNHLLPSAREQNKGGADCTRSGRRLKSGIRLKSRQLRSGRRTDTCQSTRTGWPSASVSHSLLGNFEESILKGRFSPSGRIDGFTAEIGASGSYCPQHATLPVQVTYYDISEHSAPSPFLGVISLEPLGKKGYSVPKAGTIQVTLFNPNKTVVKMFLVTFNFGDMPVNHMTFLRQRIFLVPLEEGEGSGEMPEGGNVDRKKTLCYLIHLRFQSSKSGKIYLHNDIRLLFSRKSIEVDTGIHYELKSFTEVPRNPKYSPRV